MIPLHNIVRVRPRPVRIAGLTWHVLPFRLADLAELEALAADAIGHPLDGRRGALRAARDAAGGDPLADTPEGLAYAHLIGDVWLDAEDWPPSWGSDDVADYLATAAGRVAWLVLLLGRTHPSIGVDLALTLAGLLDAEAWATLSAAAYARHPLDELVGLMDGPTDGGEIDWGKEVAALVRLTGWTLETIGGLYLPQWRAVRGDGSDNSGMIGGSEGRRERFWARQFRLVERWNGNGDGG